MLLAKLFKELKAFAAVFSINFIKSPSFRPVISGIGAHLWPNNGDVP